MISELFVIYVQHALIHPISIQAHPTLRPPTRGCSGLAVRWWHGQGHEVLFLLFQAAASTKCPLPSPDVQDAWPPVE